MPPAPLTATPTPTPTPTPSADLTSVKIFANLNVSTDFAVLGLQAPGGSSTTLKVDGSTVRYDASTGLYVMDFPSKPIGAFYQYSANSPNANWWGGALVDSSGKSLGSDLSVLKPTNPDLPLTYTTLVGYDVFRAASVPFGWVAFGSATSAAGMPVTGSATFAALARGSTVDGWGLIEGGATLQFDFGAGKLSGHFDPIFYDLGGMGESYALDSYNFTNTVYSAGSVQFSGQLANSGFTRNGLFSGVFTGPNAQELMARWQAPFRNPLTNKDSEMFGVWVGKH
jgi:hypothetical protein